MSMIPQSTNSADPTRKLVQHTSAGLRPADDRGVDRSGPLPFRGTKQTANEFVPVRCGVTWGTASPQPTGLVGVRRTRSRTPSEEHSVVEQYRFVKDKPGHSNSIKSRMYLLCSCSADRAFLESPNSFDNRALRIGTFPSPKHCSRPKRKFGQRRQ
jgi:hypothetical protein